MEYDILTYEQEFNSYAVQGIKSRLEEAVKAGWKAQGGINVVYDNNSETFHANLLIVKE